MTTQLSPLAIQHFTDNNGNLLAGGQLYTYAAGTSTPLATYTDSTGGTANANPVIMNARGEANVWTTGGLAYKFVLKDASGNLIWTVDNITDGSLNSALAAALASTSNLAQGVALVGGAARVVASIAALRLLPKTGSPEAFVTGYYAQGDNITRLYWYDSTDTTSADNGGTIIVASDGGRWKLSANSQLTIRDFGAKGDGTTDDTTAITNAFTVCALAGNTLYGTPGTYVLTSGITVNVNNGQSITSLGGRKFSFVGSSSSNCTFYYTGATDIPVFVFNDTTGNRLKLEGFRVQRPDSRPMFATGITINGMVSIALRDVYVFRLGTGIIFNDCNTVLLDRVSASYCNTGILGKYTSVTTPNLFKFTNCDISSNKTNGVVLNGGMTNSFFGCDFEGNGIDNGVTTALGTALSISTNSPVNTNYFVAANIDGCYFEGNAGAADIYVTFNGAAPINLKGNIFNRTSNVNYVTNNISFDASALGIGSGPIAIDMTGNSFVSQGTYVPDSSRRAINYLHGSSGYKQFQINDNNVYQNSVEYPLINPQIDQLRDDRVKLYAFGLVTSTGAITSNYRIASVVKNSTGNYTVSVQGPGFTTAIPIITAYQSGEIMYYIASSTGTSFTVQFNNTASAPTDSGFTFALIGGF